VSLLDDGGHIENVVYMTCGRRELNNKQSSTRINKNNKTNGTKATLGKTNCELNNKWKNRIAASTDRSCVCVCVLVCVCKTINETESAN